MPHDTPLITTIVAALVLAFIFGAIANRLKMPPLVGYLIAGVCVGPHSPGFIADQTLAPQLAEIGVILLMFGVGLNFSLKDLLSVKAVAIPGALIRLAFATAMGFGLGTLLGWPILGSVVFGLALAVSSTVVTLKVLQDRHLADSDRGRVTIGWLVVEDLAMVLALVLIPAFAGSALFAGAQGGVATAPDAFVALAEQVLQTRLELWQVLGLTLIKLLAFVGFMVIVGRRLIPYLLHATAHTGSRELFRLAVLAVALGVAAGSAYLFGVSLALGAFFAGMILSESELSQRAAQETLPLRDAFGVLFFVSVGMLFDPTIVVREPLPLLATLLIVMFGKSVVSFLLLILFRRPIAAALQISASLAQIGEFSFILAALGVSLAVLPPEGRDLILAGAIISIVLNPAVFWFSERLRPRLEARPSRRTEPELGPVVPDSDEAGMPLPVSEPLDGLEEVAQPTTLANHLVLIGYGRVGMVVAGEMLEEGAPFVLVEDAETRVLAAREAGIEVIVGNAAAGDTLRLANVMGARCVIIAIPNAFEAGQATEQCRKLNAGVKIIARAHSDEEVDYLTRLGADKVVMGEREIGLGMIDWLKGEERDNGQREGTRTEPRLSGGDNVLRQARQAQPRDATSVALAGGPLVGSAAVAMVEEPPMLVETAAPPVSLPPPNEPTAEPRITPPAAVSVDLPGALPDAVIELPPPATIEALPQETATDEAPDGPFARTPEPAGPAATLEREDPVYGPAAEIEPSWAATPVEPEDAAAPAVAGIRAVPEVYPEPMPEAPAGAATPAPEAIQTEAVPVGVEPVRATAGFRVVPASDIFILPPEPPASKGREEQLEEPATPFRSEFWQEDEPRPEDDGEPQLFASGPIPAGLRNVHEVQPEGAPVDDASWLAALERDLFGGESVAGPAAPTGPDGDPQPVPPPQEDPQPAPQPARPPQPQEDPQPAPQPFEQPTPVEIPVEAPPQAPTPGMPPTRAEDDDEDASAQAR